MDFIEENLDLTKQKIKALESQIAFHMDNIQELSESLKETQRYLVKLAHNQMELTKRISQWPYIVVNQNNEGDSV